MKRSEINAIQKSAKAFLAEHRFLLPPWAFRRPAEGNQQFAVRPADNRWKSAKKVFILVDDDVVQFLHAVLRRKWRRNSRAWAMSPA